MKIWCAIIVLFFTVGATNKHTNRFIEGTVKDAQTNQALEMATVYIDKLKIGITTNKNGYYKQLLPDSIKANKLVLVCKYVGMVEERRKINIKKKLVPVNFSLTEKTQYLDVMKADL
jgi:hypothetical protein